MANPTDFGPGRTPRLGLFYGSDTAHNANLDRLDQIVGDLQAAVTPVAAKAAPPPTPAPKA
jgi:hypothetical protein